MFSSNKQSSINTMMQSLENFRISDVPPKKNKINLEAQQAYYNSNDQTSQ